MECGIKKIYKYLTAIVSTDFEFHSSANKNLNIQWRSFVFFFVCDVASLQRT